MLHVTINYRPFSLEKYNNCTATVVQLHHRSCPYFETTEKVKLALQEGVTRKHKKVWKFSLDYNGSPLLGTYGSLNRSCYKTYSQRFYLHHKRFRNI